MEGLKETGKSYLQELKKRSKESRAYKLYQLAGLEIADILGDRQHKALYIKLAKNWGADKLLRIAKTVAENKNVKNKGAYFMRIVYDGNPDHKK